MNEINRLHSEYEMRELDVHAIAHLHKRTVYAILSKLSDEGLIEKTWIDARGYNSKEYQAYSMEKDSFDSDDENDSEYKDELEGDVDSNAETEEEEGEEEDDDEDEDYEEEEDTEGAEEEEDDDDYEEEEEEEDDDKNSNKESLEIEDSTSDFDPYDSKPKFRLLETIFKHITDFFSKK
jgi:hypothetical protein